MLPTIGLLGMTHRISQLPIPPALLAKMREKMDALSARPIATDAEARARKNRKMKSELASAKKKAQALASSLGMSDSMISNKSGRRCAQTKQRREAANSMLFPTRAARASRGQTWSTSV
jgi:hypothetical protein